jgi:hypothetical protein
MEVKPGYKQTEVGVIPEEWEVCPVGQKGEVVTGKALAVNGPGKQRPYLRTKNVFDGRIDIDDVLTMPMTDEQFAHFRVRQGDVLLNEGQSLELWRVVQAHSWARQEEVVRTVSHQGAQSMWSATQLVRTHQSVGKKRDLKQAAMQQLLTGQTRLPGFQGEWKVKPLAECQRNSTAQR